MPQTSKKTVIETTQVKKGSTIVTNSRFVRRIVYNDNGNQYVKYMGQHLPLTPHSVMGMPVYVITNDLTG
jgi:hypothetical protein